jgi:ribonucleoside-diphosphate reductase alpha chain
MRMEARSHLTEIGTFAVSIARSNPTLGERSLNYMGHLRMMVAAQPFLSGAISKTVNMPEAATVDEIANTCRRVAPWFEGDRNLP